MSIIGDPIILNQNSGPEIQGFIEPVFNGLSYSYISLSNEFYQTSGMDYCLLLYPIIANKYYTCFSVGNPGNRRRVHLYYNKTLNDFENYLKNPSSSGTPKIYDCDVNIGGISEQTGDGLLSAISFKPSSDGVLIFMTSNTASYHGAYLFCQSDVEA